MLVLFLLSVFVISLIVLINDYSEDGEVNVFSKYCSSVCFIALPFALLSLQPLFQDQVFNFTVLFALFCGFCGDLLLSLKVKPLKLLGGVFFSLQHISLIYFFSPSNYDFYFLIFLVVGTVLAFTLLVLPLATEMVLGYIYLVLISLMLVSCYEAVNNGLNPFFLLAPVLFLISDFSVLRSITVKRSCLEFFFSITFYYIAQMIFALLVLYPFIPIVNIIIPLSESLVKFN